MGMSLHGKVDSGSRLIAIIVSRPMPTMGILVKAWKAQHPQERDKAVPVTLLHWTYLVSARRIMSAVLQILASQEPVMIQYATTNRHMSVAVKMKMIVKTTNNASILTTRQVQVNALLSHHQLVLFPSALHRQKRMFHHALLSTKFVPKLLAHW